MMEKNECINCVFWSCESPFYGNCEVLNVSVRSNFYCKSHIETNILTAIDFSLVIKRIIEHIEKLGFNPWENNIQSDGFWNFWYKLPKNKRKGIYYDFGESKKINKTELLNTVSLFIMWRNEYYADLECSNCVNFDVSFNLFWESYKQKIIDFLKTKDFRNFTHPTQVSDHIKIPLTLCKVFIKDLNDLKTITATSTGYMILSEKIKEYNEKYKIKNE